MPRPTILTQNTFQLYDELAKLHQGVRVASWWGSQMQVTARDLSVVGVTKDLLLLRCVKTTILRESSLLIVLTWILELQRDNQTDLLVEGRSESKKGQKRCDICVILVLIVQQKWQSTAFASAAPEEPRGAEQ